MSKFQARADLTNTKEDAALQKRKFVVYLAKGAEVLRFQHLNSLTDEAGSHFCLPKDVLGRWKYRLEYILSLNPGLDVSTRELYEIMLAPERIVEYTDHEDSVCRATSVITAYEASELATLESASAFCLIRLCQGEAYLLGLMPK